jgi:transposase-like protein
MRIEGYINMTVEILNIKEKANNKCPKCNSEHIRKFGVYPTVKSGHKQRFQCFDCGSTFF